MSSAPTPAPHTPVNFLQAGGAAFFSARCITLLTNMGYEMAEFTSYDSLCEYLTECRARRAGASKPSGMSQQRFDELQAEGPRSRREFQLGEPTNIPGTRVRNPLAFQAGHTMMNSTQQSQRGNPCSNVVDGHREGLYPCMPHQGPVTVDGQTHNTVTALEYNQALANGATEGGAYANLPPAEGAAQAERDARKRINAVTQKQRVENDQPLSQRLNSGRSPRDQRPPVRPEELPADQTTPLDTNIQRAPKEHQVEGKSANECIDNFRKMGAEGMRQECANSAADNQATADAAGVTGADLDQAEADRQQAWADYREASAIRKETVGGPGHDADMDRECAQLHRQAMQATQRRNACHAACLAEQGRRIESGEGRNAPRAPNYDGENVPHTEAGPGKTHVF